MVFPRCYREKRGAVFCETASFFFTLIYVLLLPDALYFLRFFPTGEMAA